MKYTIRFIIVLFSLVVAGTTSVWGITEDDIIVNVLPNSSAGTVTVTNDNIVANSDGTTTVTFTANPADGYSIDANHIVAEKMVDPLSRRASGLASSLPISGSNPFTFTIPEGYTGAYVTVTFFKTTANGITSLSQITDMEGTYVLTADINAAGNTSLGDFKGTLDGGFHKIYNLSEPLFSSTSENAVIRNITFEDINISVSGNAGAVTASAAGNTRIYNCGILPTSTERDNSGYITGFSGSSVGGTGYVGSIVGQISGNARVINCYSYANITGGSVKAGIVGFNSYASKSGDIQTMVMNCMFYGDIVTGNTISPIYGGAEISNEADSKLNNYNYFRYESSYSKNNTTATPIISYYNRALPAEERYLKRFEFYRYLLNSNRELAAAYIGDTPTESGTGDKLVKRYHKELMAKWVLDKKIVPYPILKPQGTYPSIINYSTENLPDSATVGRNNGGKLGTLTVNISLGSGAPANAAITTSQLTLVRTDKDTLNYNFNYNKVQLPYYNEVGTKNYTDNKVVTGWIVRTSSKAKSFGTANYDYPNYNLADRACTVGRVYSQGAYFDVPDGTTSISIEAKWAKAVYVSDGFHDSYGTDDNYTRGDLEDFGKKYVNNQKYAINPNDNSTENSQKVYTGLGTAIGQLTGVDNPTVYDYAVVLVGNFHQKGTPSQGDTPFTIMSADLDHDNEPDYSLIIRSGKQEVISPIRFDFINVPGVVMAHKKTSTTQMGILGNMKPKGWFEVTNTCVIRISQFEYDYGSKTLSPLILLGGVVEQFVSTNASNTKLEASHTEYIHVGSNVWFKLFSNGCHMDKTNVVTPHRPISVTGGEYEKFYLSGYFQPNAPAADAADEKNAECYIDGGRFGEVAGASQEKVNGDVTWVIKNADIENFFGGGINEASPVTGDIKVNIHNSYVGLYCGGPKFGNMTSTNDKTALLETNATSSTFGYFYGAGYGGTSIYRDIWSPGSDGGHNRYTLVNYDWMGWLSDDRGYHRGQYVAGKGIATGFETEHFEGSSTATVARLYVYFATMSVAKTNSVTSNLTNCTINHDFYGGGNLGSVNGDIVSTIKDCTVEGNVFGAGCSATPPTAVVYDEPTNANFKGSYYNTNTGVFEPTEYPKTKIYTWSSQGDNSSNTLITEDGENYIHTGADLTSLGTVTGKVTLNIEGTTTVGHSVYGGGEESGVEGNTIVNITGGTIGTTGKGGATWGNVYGGGKGKADDVTAGIVKGSTNVSISGSPAILHNVYGGGAFGSVGTFSYDGSGFPTGWTTTENKGKCTVSITGGTIGTTGDNNGMVFGSSRGLEGDPSNPNVDKMAWVYDTDVTIGTQSSETGPSIKGSVYGGGENGHNFHDAKVTVHSGTIGILEGSAIVNDGGTPDDDSDDISYTGARYPNRGNVYGSGCGTDTYTADSKNYFDFNAGIVRGNTTVDIKGGHVVHNVYGGGAMGSVGTYTFDTNGKPISCADGTGTCTVTVSGGQIGVAGAKMAGYGKGGPDDYGHVFGAGRGEMHDPNQYPNLETCAYFNKAILNISGSAFLTGSAYGGSESGHVLGDTEVNISGGQIGCGKNATEPYGDDVWVDGYVPSEDLECASWPYEAPYAPHDLYANATPPLDEYSNGKSTEGGRLEASDGHTYYGNVFGGGSGCVPYFDTTEGISKYLSTAGSVEGTATVTISGGHILTNVYGGCEATNVKGSATVTMTGGTVGVPRTFSQIVAHPVTCYVFGAGKGDQRIFFNKETNVDRATVSIEGGKVYGSVFGGGEDGHVFQNTTVNIGTDEGEGPTIGTLGTTYVDGNVFGGGRGFSGDALTAGNVGGSVKLNIKSGKILGSVYGGGRLASVGYGLYLVDEEITEDEKTIKPYGILRPNGKYDGSYPDPSSDPASTYYNNGRGYITINISGGTIGNDNEYIYNPTAEQKAVIPNTTFDYQNHLQYTKGGNVFTGGMGRLYALDGTTLLSLWPKLGKCKQTELNITGGTIKSSVYGGGEIGVVAQNATVNITGGTIGTKIVDSEDATKYYYFGSVFGGGKGSVDNITYPSTTPEEEQIPISEAGTTGGNVEVNLNKDVAEDAKGAVVSQVFGCNDMNGSPKGTVTVHVYSTQTADKANISTKPTKGTDTYDVMAVYGGGNLAAYEPTDLNTGKAKVIIDGCGLTSVRQVYGGGNAASTPATDVEINGTYEIAEVFGGGNGLDALPNGRPNPGANVGYKNYTIYEQDGDVWKAKDDPAYDTKEERTAEGSSIVYGTGAANVNINGGTIHRVFGGSNTKGNVRITAVTMLEEAGGCPFCVDEAYGGGKSAPMDAEAKLLMACIPGLKEAYGGAQNAEIDGDVTLNITNGTFERIFGGNDEKGYIKGTITVNIEETGCKPIIIGELYGGGNQAPYTAPEGKHGPTLNVRSFTSIGDIYGGGLGSTATVTGDTYVNINVSEGRWRDGTYQYDTDPSVGVNDKITELNEKGYHAPEFTSGMGSIHTVFGGGNAAPVTGNTNVNVGTSEYEEIVSVATGADVTGYYTRSGEGTEASPYTYTEATGTAVEGTTYYQKVKGANIRGNVYGGGNNAEVTGDTNVTIGKKNE